jgi:hypothetical protein
VSPFAPRNGVLSRSERRHWLPLRRESGWCPKAIQNYNYLVTFFNCPHSREKWTADEWLDDDEVALIGPGVEETATCQDCKIWRRNWTR